MKEQASFYILILLFSPMPLLKNNILVNIKSHLSEDDFLLFIKWRIPDFFSPVNHCFIYFFLYFSLQKLGL